MADPLKGSNSYKAPSEPVAVTGDTPHPKPAPTPPTTVAGRKGGGKPGRSGPPKGNRNAIRHGLKAGQLPRDAKYIEYRLNQFRRQLEDAVIDAKGQVSIADAASIQTALRWERHAALALRWLTKQCAELKPEQRLTFSREIARASAERDKAIAALRLDNDEDRAPWLLPAPSVADDTEDGE